MMPQLQEVQGSSSWQAQAGTFLVLLQTAALVVLDKQASKRGLQESKYAEQMKLAASLFLISNRVHK